MKKRYTINLKNFKETCMLKPKKVELILQVQKGKKNIELKFQMLNQKSNRFHIILKEKLDVIDYYFLVDDTIILRDNKKKNNEAFFNFKNDNKIAIFATMSAGKSTFINALLGDEILPSENQACTGKIFKIKNADKEKCEILGVTKDNNTIEIEDKKDLFQINNDSNLKEISILKKFENINKNIILVDTPGINNYQNSDHKTVTYDFIDGENVDNVIYIINATQIGVTDDQSFLIDLKEKLNMEDIKILFLLNKVDLIDETYENEAKIVANVKKYLENLGYKSPKIISISAYKAKILRLGMNNNLKTRREIYEYRSYINEYIEENNLENVNEKEIINQLLSTTNIPLVEELI